VRRIAPPLVVALFTALLAGCGGAEVVEEPKPEDPSGRRSRGSSVPRSAYADCVVKLRERSPDVDDFGTLAFDEAKRVEVTGDFEGAITAYLDFISASAGSKLVPHAYFALGIVYEHQAEADSDRWIHAEQSFNAVLRYTSDLDVVTWVELAKVFNKRGKWTDTLSAANKAADRGRAAPHTPCVDVAMTQVAEHLVKAYAETGDPARAYSLFRRFYGPSRVDEAVTLTERLAVLYDQRGDTTSANTARSSVVFPK